MIPKYTGLQMKPRYINQTLPMTETTVSLNSISAVAYISGPAICGHQ